MTRGLVPIVASIVAIAAAPQSQIQNGRVERRTAAGLARSIQGLVTSASDPVWIAWREPMVDGERSLCCWYGDFDNNNGVRGCMVDNSASQQEAPKLTPPAGPVPLEGGTGVVMMVRAVEGRIERLRLFSDDCQLDAGGRTVYWLEGVAAADSLQYLEAFTAGQSSDSEPQRALVNAAVRAIALHRDAAADAILEKIAAGGGEASVRRQAAAQLGGLRGTRGFATLSRLFEVEKQPELRRAFVSALGQSAQPRTPDVLLGIARGDVDAKVRGEAVHWYARRTGAGGIENVAAIVQNDPDASVRSRGVSAIASIGDGAGIPTLIGLARSSPVPAVRKDAIGALGRSKDPRAVAYLEELLRK